MEGQEKNVVEEKKSTALIALKKGGRIIQTKGGGRTARSTGGKMKKNTRPAQNSTI